MRPGQHEQPDRVIREPWWRAALWEVLLRVGAILGLVAGGVGGFYLCRLIDEGDGRYQKQQFWLCILLAVVGFGAGHGIADAIVRRLRGRSGKESLESSDVSESGIDSPPE